MVQKQATLTVENVDGVDYLIARSGNDMHQIDLRAISSWGLLLGMTDHAEIVKKIMRFKEKPAKANEPNLWTPLYEKLGDALDQMSQAGVPAEYMEDVLASDAPVPTPEITAEIIEVQGAAAATIDANPDDYVDLSAQINTVLDAHTDKIAELRVEFVDGLAPRYEIPVDPAPTSVPEAMDLLNAKSADITPGTVA